MCRLLGVVSPTRESLTDLLGPTLQDFTALSGHHKDGWGVAWWNDRNLLERDRAPERAATSSHYAKTVRDARTASGILHLRRASAGLPLSVSNSHPFLAPGVAFAHNGFAEPVEAIDVLVARNGGSKSEGTTDSERYFNLVLALATRMPMEKALARAARLISLATRTEALNALVLTRQALFAIRFDNPEVAVENGTDPSDYRLHYTFDGQRAVVASTGWETQPDQWTEIPQFGVLEIRQATADRPVSPILHAPEQVAALDAG